MFLPEVSPLTLGCYIIRRVSGIARRANHVVQGLDVVVVAVGDLWVFDSYAGLEIEYLAQVFGRPEFAVEKRRDAER